MTAWRMQLMNVPYMTNILYLKHHKKPVENWLDCRLVTSNTPLLTMDIFITG